MTECTCGDTKAKSVDEEIVETEEVEIVAGLDEPVEVGKEEALMKDMEATLAKLKEVLAYLEDMGEEKAEEDEEEAYDSVSDDTEDDSPVEEDGAKDAHSVSFDVEADGEGMISDDDDDTEEVVDLGDLEDDYDDEDYM